MANLTVKVEKKVVQEAEPMVGIYIPAAEDSGDGHVDQTERVQVNGADFAVPRGVFTEVPYSVFAILKNKYPKL